MHAFKSIKDRIWKCLQNWKNNFLSQAGKEILIKAVVQAIPTYCMSVFQLTHTLCKEIRGMMQRFWWGRKDNQKKISWMSWERMGRAKTDGGLGFRDLVAFNKALLAKQIWRLLQNPSSLAARIIGAKYCPSKTVLEAKLGNRPSFAWRSIMAAQGTLKQGLIWRIGNGRDIKIWGDQWLPTPVSFMVQSPRLMLGEDARVAELIDQDTKFWNTQLVETIFNAEKARVIKGIPLIPVEVPDRLRWRCIANGAFTVRSAYHLEMETNARKDGEGSGKHSKKEFWKVCWQLHTPNVVKMFLWRALHNLLPTNRNLKCRGVIQNSLWTFRAGR
jgi:hypothetical protein